MIKLLSKSLKHMTQHFIKWVYFSGLTCWSIFTGIFCFTTITEQRVSVSFSPYCTQEGKQTVSSAWTRAQCQWAEEKQCPPPWSGACRCPYRWLCVTPSCPGQRPSHLRSMKPASVSEASQQEAWPLLLSGWNQSSSIFISRSWMACVQASTVMPVPDSLAALLGAGSDLVTAWSQSSVHTSQGWPAGSLDEPKWHADPHPPIRGPRKTVRRFTHKANTEKGKTKPTASTSRL
jgi:hypothetical protein